MNNAINSAKEIILEVNKKVKRVYWTNEEINKYFGRRPVNQILLSGETGFMNPCLDLTLASSHLMNLKGIEHDLIIEEHSPSKDFNFDKSKKVIKNFDYRLHFGIDFLYDKEKWGIDYKRENEVYILKGGYTGRGDIPRSSITRINGKNLSPNKPLYETLGYNSLQELIKDKFNGFSLEKNICRLNKDNDIQNFEEYKKRNGKRFKIVIIP